MKLQKIAGISSIATSIIVLINILLVGLELPRLGIVHPSIWNNTAKVLEAMSLSPISFFGLSFIEILFGIAYIFIVMGIKERMQDSAPNFIQVIIIATAVTCALWTAAGSIGIYGWPSIVHTKNTSALNIAIVMFYSLLFAGDSAAGWVLLLIGWAGLKTGGLPKAVCYLTLLKAIQMIFEIVAQPWLLAGMGLLLGVIFYPWLGIVLLRSKR